MNTSSLSFRLVTWYAGVLTFVFVLLGVLTLVLLRHNLEANLLDTQARRARQIGDTLIARTGRGAEDALRAQLESLYSPEANGRFIRVTRDDGAVVYASGAPKDALFDPAHVPPLPHGTVDVARRVPFGEGSLFIAARTASGADGTRYRVEVGVPGTLAEATLANVMILLAIGLPLAVAVAVAGGFVLVKRSLDPVARIAAKAEEITQHSLSERLPVVRTGDELEQLSVSLNRLLQAADHAIERYRELLERLPVVRTGDELEQLSVSLNRMISRLEEAIQGSKQLVADASHELRTPLTVMRGELESLAQDGQLAPDTREALGSVLEEVERLAEIVEGLFALSRLDAGEANAEWVPFDLAELASSTAEQMSLLAEDKKVSVACEAPGGVTVEGDRARLKQVVVNLLDNAIKYTPSGGRVALSVRSEGGFAVLDITDTGIGIPAEALPHVFKRFFRVDGSRSREQGGAGLGLSIVKSICTAHGAVIEVMSAPGRGSTFRIRQPLALESTSHAP